MTKFLLTIRVALNLLRTVAGPPTFYQRSCRSSMRTGVVSRQSSIDDAAAPSSSCRLVTAPQKSTVECVV
jgi:hypothetical protein